MVAAIALMLPFTGAITAFGIPLTTAAGTLTLAGSLLNIAGSLLLSTAVTALSAGMRPDPAKPDNIQINSKNAAAPRVGHVGIVKVGGNVVFHRAKDGVSYRVITHGHGRVDEVLQTFLNNVPVTLDGSGWVTDDQYQYDGNRVRVLQRLGTVPATHYSQVTSIWPEWTEDHRLDQQWTSLIICKSVPAEEFRRVYPNSEPEVRVVAQTSRFRDPRTDSTDFTENAALCIAGYIASPVGLNRPDAIDDDILSEEADIADLDMPLAAGGTEKRFRLSGSYLFTEKPQDVLGRMLSACAGRVRLRPNGKIAVRMGTWREPEFVLTWDMLAEAAQEITFGPDKLDRYNHLPARYTDHDLGFIEVDAEAWRDDDRIAADGEELVGQAKSLLMSPSHRQTRQVMKIMMERENPLMGLSLMLKPTALAAAFEEAITVDIPQLGISGDFEVVKPNILLENGLVRGVALSLRMFRSTAASLSLEEQGAVQELPEPDTPSGVPIPDSVVAAAAGVKTAQNAFLAGIGVAWEPPPSDALTPVVRWRVATTGEWQDYAVGSKAINVIISGVLTDGVDYDVAVHFKTPGGVIGTGAVVSGVTAEADTATPDAPTSLSVTDLGGGVARVRFRSATTESLWKTEIYRGGTRVGIIYTGPDEIFTFADECGSGTFNWTAKSFNVSAKQSAAAGPVTQTIA